MVRIGEQLVVVELADERNAVCVPASDGPEHAEGRGDRIAAALHRELDDLRAIEVDGVGSEGGAGGVLDALVDWQDGKVAGARQSPVGEDRFQAAQHARRAVAVLPDPVDEVRPGQMQLLFRNRVALVLEQILGLRAQHFLELFQRTSGDCSHHRLFHI